MDKNEKQEFLLTQLIFMFQSAALQQMGKLKNPMSDKIQRDLQQAQISIDMLEMIHEKMKPQLSDGEEKMFAAVLRELRLNYVDEVAKGGKSGREDAEHPPQDSPGTA